MTNTPDVADTAGLDTERNRALQREWYGESLGERFRRLIEVLGLSQSRLAAVLGLSAPMVSQLMSGHRAKIANPLVVTRLQAVQELAEQVVNRTVDPIEVPARLEQIRALAATTTTRSTAAAAAPSPHRVVREIQALLRALASADELIAASGMLAGAHPELAEFLRLYGAGRTDDALAHYEAVQNPG